MDINEYRSNPGRCAALESILDSPAFREAIEAIATSNKTTEALTVAGNINGDPMVESRLLNQQLGRDSILRDLRVCAIPLNPPKPQVQADYGAEEAMAALSAPDAPADPWQPVH